ncbi:hypothetical protein TAMA11512_10670 [Selenomonas sp. TAMA-11512]|uniref:hypothetical protein n=1 Tax=Selenomonas sp. TAMA-11512 TaxID=3095337 RepID=UPI00308DABBA|nr:hypothetical protein TAMA11512_10670 [Selenomonas sp. TAMA-11512]
MAKSLVEKNVGSMREHWAAVDAMLKKGGELLSLDNLARKDGGLLRFLTPTDAPLSVLVIDGAEYLPHLRAMLPQAAIYAVVREQDLADDARYAGLDVAWTVTDWREERLPYPLASFDYVLADFCLELAGNPQDIASGFGYYIKDTGYLLTSFENVRHWKTIEALKKGHFYSIVRHPFTTAEMETLLGASFYKSVSFSAIREEAPVNIIEGLVEAGFENYQNDLEVRYWLVKARRSVDEVALLKSYFTPDVRRELVTYLRRLEYGIEVAENGKRLWALIERERIFADYLASFIVETVVHHRSLLESLLVTGEFSFLRALLENLCGLLPEELPMLEDMARALVVREEKQNG